MPKQMKFLICPGYGKSGTTLLHHCLSLSKSFQIPKNKKEIKYFMGKAATLPGYLSHFAAPGPATQVYFESSPPYLTGSTPEVRRAWIEKIKATLPDPKILICLRHPTYRAHSHYVHNLQSYSRYGALKHGLSSPREVLARPYGRSFFGAMCMESNVNPKPLDGLKDMVNAFGPRNIKLFFLERDADNFGRFYSSLCKWLDIEDDGTFTNTEVPRILEASGAPVMFYGGEDGKNFACGLKQVKLPARVFAVVALGTALVLTDVSPEEASHVERMMRTWTLGVTSEEFERYYALFHEDMTGELLSYIRENFPDEQDVPDYTQCDFKPKFTNPTEIDVDWLQRRVDAAANSSD